MVSNGRDAEQANGDELMEMSDNDADNMTTIYILSSMTTRGSLL